MKIFFEQFIEVNQINLIKWISRLWQACFKVLIRSCRKINLVHLPHLTRLLANVEYFVMFISAPAEAVEGGCCDAMIKVYINKTRLSLHWWRAYFFQPSILFLNLNDFTITPFFVLHVLPFHLPAISLSCPFSCQCMWCRFPVFGKLQRTSGSSVQSPHFHWALNAFWLMMMMMMMRQTFKMFKVYCSWR